MSRDLYISLSGATASWAQLEMLSNNLANSSTVGFKQDKLPFKVEGPNAGPLGQVYATADEPVADLSDGTPVQDNDPYHLAMQGEGFLAVQAGNKIGLTRDGRFHLDPVGRVVNNSGYALLGEKGPITVPPGDSLRISEDGKVYSVASGDEVDHLKLVNTNRARQVGNNLWEATSGVAPATGRVIQGALETSNVSPMSSMIELTQISRYFEAYQKAMQTSDELDGRMLRLSGKG